MITSFAVRFAGAILFAGTLLIVAFIFIFDIFEAQDLLYPDRGNTDIPLSFGAPIMTIQDTEIFKVTDGQTICFLSQSQRRNPPMEHNQGKVTILNCEQAR